MNTLLSTREVVKKYFTNFKGNIMSAPRITHVTLSTGCGKFHKDTARVNSTAEELSMIAGQKAVFSKAKKSVSNFKIREGMVSGCYVTLRGSRMYSFLDQLTTIALARIPDFAGLSVKSIARHHKQTNEYLSGQTNINIGIKSNHIFPVVSVSEKNIGGINICIGIKSTKTHLQNIVELLKEIGFPFRDSFKSVEQGKA